MASVGVAPTSGLRESGGHGVDRLPEEMRIRDDKPTSSFHNSQDMEPAVVAGHGTETGPIIVTTIGGRNGQAKQTTSYMEERIVGQGSFGVVFQMTNPKTSTVTPSQFANTLAKISVAQILKSAGFKSSKSTALETLTRITTLFLHHLSSTAATFSDKNPTLTDVISALEDLNSPLDFSLPNLVRFVADSDQLPPFLHRRTPKSEAAAVAVALVSEGGRDSTRSRGSEIPSWLPAFPSISSSNGDDANVEGKWEEDCVRPAKEVEKEKVVRRKTKRGVGEMMVFGRRERLKFRLVGGKHKAKAGNVELSNGVCRGGKRVCLAKRDRIFHNDDDYDVQ